MPDTRIAIRLNRQPLTLADLRQIYRFPADLTLADDLWTAIDRGAAAVARIVEKGSAAYGVNTGFGLLAQSRIPNSDLARLQTNLVRSHAAGVGAPIVPELVRMIVALKIMSLSQGHSGVRRELVAALQNLLFHDLMPVIPSRGSVGASGDLAPLAHLAGALIGEGEVWLDGQRQPAARALAACGLTPLTLGPKEGLALLNGSQVSTALALAALFDCEHLFAGAVVAGALSVDAMNGSVVPFDARISELRRQPGQQAVAGCYRELLAGSAIVHSHLDCGKVQDPYSLRCQPQVMGACLDLMHHAGRTLINEANAITDNPLIFPDSGEVLSGGNFHAQPVAFAADMLALAIAEIGSLSERRTALLVDPKMSGLPPFLVDHSGLNSGFMIAQVTAAALVSENKSLAHPASVDSIPTSANQEDHVSMATFAARRLGDMNDNARHVVAIELLSACQAVEFHRPCKTSPALEAVLAMVRETVANYAEDRSFTPDIAQAAELLSGDRILSTLTPIWPSATLL